MFVHLSLLVLQWGSPSQQPGSTLWHLRCTRVKIGVKNVVTVTMSDSVLTPGLTIYNDPLSSGAIYHNQKFSVQNIQVTALFLARDDWRFLQLKWQMRWRQVTSAVAN